MERFTNSHGGWWGGGVLGWVTYNTPIPSLSDVLPGGGWGGAKERPAKRGKKNPKRKGRQKGTERKGKKKKKDEESRQ